MKFIIQQLVIAVLLILAQPTRATTSAAPEVPSLEVFSNVITNALAEQVIHESVNELNQVTGQQLPERDWVTKYYLNELTITQLQKDTFRLQTGSHIVVTILNP